MSDDRTPPRSPVGGGESHPVPARPSGSAGRRVRPGPLGLLGLLVVLMVGAIGAASAPARPATARASTVGPTARQSAIIHSITWGIDDQHLALFADPRWHALPLRYVRYFVPWDLVHEPHYLHLADRWLTIAGKTGTVPLVAITQSDLPGRSRYLPTLAQYRRAVRFMMRRWPWIKEWTPWNEANLLNQATLHNPARAAGYWRVALSLCHKCTVTSPSLVGYKDASPKWIRAFLRAAHGLRGPWAIHVYNDINEFNLYALSVLERELPRGPIWVTEVGGWYRFVGYPPNLQRQARAEQYLFEVAAATYPRISRWYLYQWFASSPKDRWDSGLVNPNGSARPALKIVQRYLG